MKQRKGVKMEHLSNNWHLEEYHGRNSRHECPKCHDKQSFTYYIDDSGNILNKLVGRCNHESGCGYHYTPKDFFIDNPDSKVRTSSMPAIRKNPIEQKPKEAGFIPFDWVKRCSSYNSNFVEFLCSLFPSDVVERVCSDYAIGATKNKSVIYWQIDRNGKVRTGKVMQYDSKSGHRIGHCDKNGGINWVHSILKNKKVIPEEWHLSQCLFGEHLLKIHPDRTVAFVESEKSAIIGSCVFPEFNWLSCGGIDGIKSEDRMKVLEGKTVIVFPDVDGFQKWKEAATKLSFCKIYVSDLLEKNASDKEREAKIDISDWIIKQKLTEGIKSVQSTLSEEERLFQGMIVRNEYFAKMAKCLDLSVIVNNK